MQGFKYLKELNKFAWKTTGDWNIKMKNTLEKKKNSSWKRHGDKNFLLSL